MERKASITALMSSFGRAFHAENEEHPVFADHLARALMTDEEYAVMKSHVVRGGEILKNFTLVDHVYEGALYHHERYDGKGYVQGLKGEKIPLNARIIGIADAFDAMTANRVYRKKLDMEFVLNEIKKGRGTQFDPMLVDIMLDLIEDGTIDVQKIYAP